MTGMTRNYEPVDDRGLRDQPPGIFTSDGTGDHTLVQALADLRIAAPDAFVVTVLDRLGIAEDWYVVVDGPTGPLFIAFNTHGFSYVLAAAVVDGDPAAFEAAFRARHRREARPSDHLPQGLVAALRSGQTRNLPFDLRGLTSFEKAVLLKALEIPASEVRPYAWVAEEIGRPKAVRAVGSALGRNPVPVLIPCHRVVRSDGRVGEYVFGSMTKRALLQHEGVDLDTLSQADVQVVGSDTTKIFCYPSCPHARRISPNHRVPFRTVSAARQARYRPCRHCRPAVRADGVA